MNIQRTSKNNPRGAALPIPPELNSEEFKTAWEEWTTHRREIKKRLTASSIRKQLKLLASWGAAKAIRSIESSIRNGWAGLFDPDGRTGDSGAAVNSEADQAWQTVLNSLQRHSRFQPEQIRSDIGERAWEALKGFGLKRLDEATDFDRRELKVKFFQEFNRQGVAA